MGRNFQLFRFVNKDDIIGAREEIAAQNTDVAEFVDDCLHGIVMDSEGAGFALTKWGQKELGRVAISEKLEHPCIVFGDVRVLSKRFPEDEGALEAFKEAVSKKTSPDVVVCFSIYGVDAQGMIFEKKGRGALCFAAENGGFVVSNCSRRPKKNLIPKRPFHAPEPDYP